MNKLFIQSIDMLLEEADLFSGAEAAQQQLDTARDQVRSAEAALQSEIEAINNTLALKIRRLSPSLTVTMGRDGNCTVRYRNSGNFISLKADARGHGFVCGNSPFERRFKRYHGHTLDLEVDILAKAVSDFFKQNYRSLVREVSH